MAESDDQRTSPTLLAKVRDYQDRDAWVRFFDRYGPMIATFCRRWGLSPADVDEVSSAVLLKLAERMHGFAYDPAHRFRGWLRAVVDSTVKNHFRARSRRPGDWARGDTAAHEALHQVEGDGPAELVSELEGMLAADRRVGQEAVTRVKERVEPHTWEAFWRTTYEDQKGKDVAAALGLSVAAVHKAKSRVAQLLKEEAARLRGDDATGG